MRKTLPKLAVILATLALGRHVAAQPLIAQVASIECVVANADLVFVAKIIKVGDAEKIDGREVCNTTIEIEETLKQEPFNDEPYTKLQMEMPRDRVVLTEWKEQSTRLLVMYDEDAPHATELIELVPGEMELFKADFTLLRDPDPVILAAKEAIARMPKGVKRVHTFGLHVPHETVAETSWKQFHGLILNVPVDQQLEQRALKFIRSESYQRREEGARALRYFPSDDNTRELRKLLKDPGFGYLHHAQQNNGVEVRIYGVRHAAFHTLKAWGAMVDEPVTREEVRKFSQ